MKIIVIGSGYVGLVSGTCFAEMGNQVTCIDIDKIKIDGLKKGIIPIYEPGLKDLVLSNLKKGSLSFNTNIEESLKESEVVFIAVGTPMGDDGSADLKFVLSVAKAIGRKMDNDIIVVEKSTVPVGTSDKVSDVIREELNNRKSSLKFHVVSNPEFLKEGNAINDFMKPDRVVIGANNDDAMIKMKELYSPFFRTNERFIAMDIRSAEMTKYAANAMLATKISFMNEMSNICERVGADINKVRNGIGSDKRIGYSFIYPGCGYGGSCFPKDVNALIKTAQEHNYNTELIKSVEAVNKRQKMVIVDKIIQHFGEDLSSFSFALWGLSFKPETDDMRDAPSLVVVNELIQRGAKIIAYDPKAMGEAKNYYFYSLEKISYVENKYLALNNSDALILLTEWKEFRSPNFKEIKRKLRKPIIFDGRNQYTSLDLKERGFEYYQIGVKKSIY
jgi:UDPglucose 6-dehydrogenase